VLSSLPALKDPSPIDDRGLCGMNFFNTRYYCERGLPLSIDSRAKILSACDRAFHFGHYMGKRVHIRSCEKWPILREDLCEQDLQIC